MAKPKFWTFDHPVLDNLPSFCSQKLPTLVELVQKGDLTAKDALLYQLLGYIKTRLGKIICQDTRLKRDIDGLVSYLIEWLVRRIDGIANGQTVDNILHYISVSLRYRCLDYLDTMLSYGPVERRYYLNVTQCNICLETIPMPPDANELLESLQTVATTDNEHEFIRLRIEGYKNIELAKLLGITTTDVSRIRKTLMRHFNEAS